MISQILVLTVSVQAAIQGAQSCFPGGLQHADDGTISCPVNSFLMDECRQKNEFGDDHYSGLLCRDAYSDTAACDEQITIFIRDSYAGTNYRNFIQGFTNFTVIVAPGANVEGAGIKADFTSLSIIYCPGSNGSLSVTNEAGQDVLDQAKVTQCEDDTGKPLPNPDCSPCSDVPLRSDHCPNQDVAVLV